MSKARARITLSVNARARERIARAAELCGAPVSAFVRDAVMREVDRVMATQLTATLSVAESRRFLAALDKPFKPNARLGEAMQGAAELWR